MQELVKQLRILLPLLTLRDIIRTSLLLAIAVARHQIPILKVGSLLLETSLVVVNVVHTRIKPDIDGRCRLQQSIGIDTTCILV